MIFRETPLNGAFIVEMEQNADERGFFARSWCRREFSEHGLDADLAQCSVSFNRAAHTLRGLHYQAAPHAEAKLVRCTRGSLFDVIADVRPDSPTRGRWFGIGLSAGNRLALYIPEGVAHGFQTLEKDTEVLYQISAYYHPECARGIRWNDPDVGIAWPPAAERVISERDAALPLMGDGPC